MFFPVYVNCLGLFLLHEIVVLLIANFSIILFSVELITYLDLAEVLQRFYRNVSVAVDPTNYICQLHDRPSTLKGLQFSRFNATNMEVLIGPIPCIRRPLNS